MRRTTLGLQLLAALTLAPASALTGQDAQVATAAANERWSNEELDNLLAPIALYPDPILAQVLIAATYPDQVLAAQAHVRAFGSDKVDEMPWEISVKAVSRYEPVLNLLAEGEDWMTALGQAYATQPVDVMTAVQRLRVMANAQGNLQSTEQQQVVVEREVIRIVPAEPQIIYVPTYDPAVVFHRPVYVTQAHPAYWNWGLGYPMGAWLTYDMDWWGHRVYYHGWHAHGPSWVVLSRPWIVLNPWYLSPRHTVVVVNRGVVYRRWDTNRVRRYSTIHRNVGYDRHDRGFRRDVSRGNTSTRGNGGGRDAEGNRGVGRGNESARGNTSTRGTAIARSGAGREGERVVPLPGAPSRDTRSSTARNSTARNSTATPRGSSTTTRSSTTPRNGGETARSSNGTWNPRSSGPSAEPARAPRAGTASTPRSSTAPRVSTPRSSTQSAPRASAPRSSGSSSAPRASAPRSSGSGSASAPRASAPRSSGSSAPRASAPRSSGSSSASAPRASAPRSSGSSSASAPRASAPRSSGSSAPRASAPRSGGSSGGGAARGSGRPRGD